MDEKYPFFSGDEFSSVSGSPGNDKEILFLATFLISDIMRKIIMKEDWSCYYITKVILHRKS